MKLPLGLSLAAILWSGAGCGQVARAGEEDVPPAPPAVPGDTIAPPQTECGTAAPGNSPGAPALAIGMPEGDEATRYTSLTDADFETVARELDVEVAAIKAVVLIEAGKKMEGFSAPGVPVINFDRTMYAQALRKAKGCKGDKSARVPAGITGYALREWTQLTNARRHNADAALMGTFWGMFQIGGFNYRSCGCATVAEMVEMMSESEFAQLELFARFLINTGFVKDLRAKNWSAFARKYNGANYARQGYHTKMAAAYRKFKNK